MKKISQQTAKVSLILNIILIAVSISLFIFSFVQRIEADKRKAQSEEQMLIAQKYWELAEMSRLQADSAAMLALEQAYKISVLEDSIANMKQSK